MQNLTRANRELFARSPDEHFGSLIDLWQHCHEEKEQSVERWHAPQAIKLDSSSGRLRMALGGDGTFDLNDWSFAQLCRVTGVSKDTVNRLTPETAERVFVETMPSNGKPLQVLTSGSTIRSLHPASYTRLFNVDLLTMVREFATDFVPPQPAGIASAEQVDASYDVPFEPDPEPTPATGLYCGEQDMFCFLIDPTGWAEIEGESFAPGFFLWNSEVGRRSVGVQTFWFQSVCANHIVWDAVEVVEFSRKHTANVHESFSEIRRIIENLIQRRDERRDGFVKTIRKAMTATLGTDAEEALAELKKRGFTQALGKKALELARERGRFSIFAVVDALTRLAGEMKNCGDRTEVDVKAGQLLALA